MAWQPVLCETNMTTDTLTKIQKALLGRGFDPGRIDGSVGTNTLKALEDFQQKHSLAKGGLTYETLKALNIDGFVKSPISAFRFSPRHCGVRYVRLIPRDSRALILNFLQSRSKIDFLHVHHT